jgi:hypothetical protein
LSHKTQNGSTKYKNNFWVAESGSSFEPPQLKVAQHWANLSKMSTLAQKRLKIFNVAQKGPKKLSLSLIKFLLGSLRAKFSDNFIEFIDFPLNCRFLEEVEKGRRKELEGPHADWPTLLQAFQNCFCPLASIRRYELSKSRVLKFFFFHEKLVQLSIRFTMCTVVICYRFKCSF